MLLLSSKFNSVSNIKTGVEVGLYITNRHFNVCPGVKKSYKTLPYSFSMFTQRIAYTTCKTMMSVIKEFIVDVCVHDLRM